MIQITGLKKAYGNLQVIKSITTTIQKGDIISIIGPSGTGKSTLMRCINLLETPDEGSILFDGVELLDKKTDINRVRRKMGMVFQGFNLLSHLNVMGNLTLGPVKLLGISKEEAKKSAMDLLKMVGLAEKAEAYPDELSGGQKQRVAIVRCLAMKPEIILFDEPTSALDPTMVGEVTTVIKKLAELGMTMMIVTHEMKFARNVSNRVFYMDEGGIYEDGSPEQIFDSPQREKTRTFIHQMKSFQYVIHSENFDFIDMMNKLVYFCNANMLSTPEANKAQLIVEELVTILPPKAAEVSLSFPESRAYYEVQATYNGDEINVIQGDSLSSTIIRNSTKDIQYRYDGINHLQLKW